jgi:hypothetical protein
MTAQSVDIAHLIQVALTPIFLISAIGVTLSVLTSRLARIVDRARTMEDRLLRSDYVQDSRDLRRLGAYGRPRTARGTLHRSMRPEPRPFPGASMQ